MIKASLDASQVMQSYGHALRRMAELSGFDPKVVLLSETGVILKTWAGRTKVARDEAVDRRTVRHIVQYLDFNKATDEGDISINMGIRGPFGRIWVRTHKGEGGAGKQGGTGRWRLAGVITPGGQNFRPMKYHWKNATWTDIQEAAEDFAIQYRKKIPKGRRAAQLSRQSIVQIADSLGIDLLAVKGGGTFNAAGLAKARQALATTGRTYANGSGTALGTAEKAVVTILNRLPYGKAIGMDSALVGIIVGRAKYFERSYAAGAFETMGKISKAYPWMRFHSSLN